MWSQRRALQNCFQKLPEITCDGVVCGLQMVVSIWNHCQFIPTESTAPEKAKLAKLAHLATSLQCSTISPNSALISRCPLVPSQASSRDSNKKSKGRCDRLSRIFPTKAATRRGRRRLIFGPIPDPVGRVVSHQQVNGYQPSRHIDYVRSRPPLAFLDCLQFNVADEVGGNMV